VGIGRPLRLKRALTDEPQGLSPIVSPSRSTLINITKLTTLVSTMADKLGVSTPVQRDLAEIQQDVSPEAVLEEIENKARH
jgi:hypothetical protein